MCHAASEMGEVNAACCAAGKLVGDTLLAAAFVSYAGPFTLPFRKRLVEEQWAPDLVARNIPLTEGFQPLHMLASDALKVREFLWHLTQPVIWCCASMSARRQRTTTHCLARPHVSSH